MPASLLLAVAVSAAVAPPYHANLELYFPDSATEHVQRVELMARIEAYAARPAGAPATPCTDSS